MSKFKAMNIKCDLILEKSRYKFNFNHVNETIFMTLKKAGKVMKVTYLISKF